MRTLLKRFLPQALKKALYYRPKDHIERLRTHGILGFLFLDRWARNMERSVESLPPQNGSGQPVHLWFLTGNKFWYQTAYCAWTFGWHADRPVCLHLVDDGTLQTRQIAALERLFFKVEVVTAASSRDVLRTSLPNAQFPMLNQRWHDYIHLRKVIDVHLGAQGPRLVLDSDMLFFARPDVLLDWLDSEDDRPLLYMTDCEESYGYSRQLMESLTGAPLPKLLNVGICGLTSDRLNWSQLEAWSSTLVAREGTSYFLEQALVAMLASQTDGLQAPVESYITRPTPDQVRRGHGVLQHYVSSSKPDYFRYAWRVARKRCGV